MKQHNTIKANREEQNMFKEYIINEFGINPKVADICFDAEKKVEKYLKKQMK